MDWPFFGRQVGAADIMLDTRARVIPGHVLPEWHARVSSGRVAREAPIVNLEGRFAWVECPADVRILERLLAKERAAFRCVDEWRPSPEQREASRQVVGWIPPPPDLARLLHAHTEALERLQWAEHRIAAKQAGLRPAQIPSLPAVARADKSPKHRTERAFVSRMADYARLFNLRFRDGRDARRRVEQLQAIVEQPFTVEIRTCEECREEYVPLTCKDRYCGPRCKHTAEERRFRRAKKQKQATHNAELVQKNLDQMRVEREQHFANKHCSRVKPCQQVLELDANIFEAEATLGSESRAKSG